MDNDFEIELQDEQKDTAGEVSLPQNFLTFGEIENDDVKVYIRQDIYKALEKLAASDTSKELGSIIIGDYTESMGKTHVVISDYIEAKYTDASASTLTFTHDTWDYVHKVHAEKHSDKRIVGWQHTHPNYGIFLSNYDMFIQENFFNLPFQVAYVIDPIQNIRGFFQWKNGKIEKLKGYNIYDEVGKPIKIEQAKKPDKPTEKRASSKLTAVILSVLCVIVAALGIFSFTLNNKYNEQQKKQAVLTEKLDEQQTTINEQDIKILTLEEEIAAVSQDEQPEEPEDDKMYFQPYTVKEGDNLSNICKEHGIDYQGYKRIILSVNGIKNANTIYVGQVILLPIAE